MSQGGRVARGRHGRRRGARLGWLPILAAFVVVLILLLAGAAFAGFRYDRAQSTRILPGVSIAGVDVGGMTRDEARRALEPASRSILARTIEVTARGQRWTVTPASLGTTVDTADAVEEALSVQRSMGWTD